MREALMLGVCMLAACTTRPPATQYSMVAVDRDPQNRTGHVLLRWDGDYDGTRARYALIDVTGYRGLVENRGRSDVDCDHCPGPLVDGILMSGPGPRDYGAVAVGPVDGPLPHARMRQAPPHDLDDTWRPVVQIDLDGDGRWDLESVQRCGHSVRSGCAGEVCDMTCVAVREPGHEPDTKRMQCVSFLPDVEDCPANAP
jgi:hypothetical protein